MSGLEKVIFEAHSGVRWLVLLMTIVAFGYLVYGLFQKRPYDRTMHRVMTIWSSLVGAQWVLGILLFIVLGGFDLRYRWEHAAIMTVVLIVAHGHIPLKKRDDNLRYRGGLAAVVLAMVLVYAGVALLPQGWTG